MYIPSQFKKLIKLYKFVLSLINYLNHYKSFRMILSHLKLINNSLIFKVFKYAIKLLIIINFFFSFGKVEPLLFNGKLITIKLTLKIDGYYGKTIIFKDSLLLLPVGLRELALTSNCTEMKGIFPFKLTDINYNGVFPRFEYFTDITIEQYLLISQSYNNKIWNFKEESIKYCKLDCQILYEILTQFNELIFNEFKVNVHKVLTLPALTIKIFKTLFMPENSIYEIHGLVEKCIRESYTGGAVDIYIPHNRITPWLSSDININYEKIKCYDVNALYPTVMSTKAMPIGKPIAFQGDIRVVEQDAFGFFYCEITSPANLEHPILQRKIKTVNGIRTIAGLGTWSAWISSSEMDNAMKFGYSFKIIKGYQFEKGDIFSKMVNKCYNLRLQYPKAHPMNNIAKLLMNSLYGKFGMKDEITKMVILENMSDLDKEIISVKLDLYGPSIKDIVKFENHTIFVINTTVDLFYNQSDDFYHGTEVNVAIASAITAEARIFMSYFKNNPNIKLYYSDTDSAFIFGDLPSDLIGKGLGQVKLEYTINKAVFLAPKVYAIITDEGKEIIKVKGLTHEVISKLHFSDLEALLIKDSTREFTQEKWFKSVINGEITTSDVIYTLKNTSNKREQIYENGIFNNTKPFNYDEIKKS